MKSLLLLLLLAVPASAQTVAGTLAWDPDPTAAKYVLTDNGGAAQDLGLPANNTASLPLTPGSHTLVLSACFSDLTCKPTTLTVTVAGSGGGGTTITYSNLMPADGYTVKNGTACKMSVTTTDDSGIARVTGYWSYNNGAYGARGTTKSGDTYAWTETPTSGAGPRKWYFKIEATDKETVSTPVQLITVTATSKTHTRKPRKG